MLQAVKKVRLSASDVIKRRFKTDFKLVEIVDDGFKTYFLFTKNGSPYDVAPENDKAFFEMGNTEFKDLCFRIIFEKGYKRRKLKGLSINTETFEVIFVISV
jgi:hypothetical protein